MTQPRKRRTAAKDGIAVKLSTGDLHLKPLNIEDARTASGVVYGLLADCYGAGVKNNGDLAMRICEAALRNPRNTVDILYLIALASGAQDPRAFVKQYAASATSSDLVMMASAVIRLSGVKVGAKSNPPVSVGI